MKIKIKKNLDEISSAGGGALAIASGPLQAYPDVDTDSKTKEENQRPEDSKIEELFSTSTVVGGVAKQLVSAEEEYEGFKERADAQNLQNVKEVKKNARLKVKIKRNLRK